MYIYLNNNIVKNNNPSIYPNDRGLLLGDGLFETIKYKNNKLLMLKEHINRLKKSLTEIHIESPKRIDDLDTICKELVELNTLKNKTASIRITVTRGLSSRGINIANNIEPTLMVSINEYHEQQNIPSAYITSITRNELSILSRIKSLNYLEPIMARYEAQQKGFDEGIMVNTKGKITECSVANIFFIIENQVITPRVEDGVLPGTVRNALIGKSDTVGIQIIEKEVSDEDLRKASGAFITNSLIGLQPISKINDIKFELNKDNLTNKLEDLCLKEEIA